MDVSNAGLSYRIVLVHGTFARGASWTQDDSRLSTALKAGLGGVVEIERCEWSGGNSAGAREAGARTLAAYLLNHGERPPGERRFVVAHSHGGSVALYALRDAAVAKLVDGVVTLATPFLVARRRDLGPNGTANMVLVLLAVLLAAYYWLVAPRLEASIGELGSLAGSFAVTMLALIGLWLLFVRWNRLAERVLASLRLAALPPHKLFIVRTTGDEASAVLLFFQFLSLLAVRLFHTLQNIYGRIRRRLTAWSRRKFALLAAAIGGLLLTVGSVWLALDAGWPVTQGFVIALVVAEALLIVLPIVLLLGWVETATGFLRLAAALALIPAALVLAVCMLPIDWRVALANLLVDVTAEAAPPGVWTIHQVVPKREAADNRAQPSLAHSAVYEDETAIREIIDWIRRSCHQVDETAATR